MEKRDAPRQKCLLQAFVYFDGRGTAVDCIASDFSGIGARLPFYKTLHCDGRFDLHIPIKAHRFHSERRRQNGDLIGVTFRAGAKTKADDTGVDKRGDRLREEIIELKKAIKHLRNNDDKITETRCW